MNDILLKIAVLVSFASASSAQAESWSERFGATLGVHYEAGRLGNSQASLDNRTMTVLSGEALVGYRFGGWLIGPEYNYGVVEQMTSLASAGGTNLRGQQGLLGLGAKYVLSPLWSLQGSVNFVGGYDLKRDTFATEDDSLKSPMGARLRAEYFFWRDVPLSADANVSYVRYATLTINGTDYSRPTQFLAAGVGLTWHFGHGRRVSKMPETPPSPSAPPAVISKPEDELAKVVETKRTDRGLMLNIKGDVSFASGSSELSPLARNLIDQIVEILLKNPERALRIEGHTDSSGKAKANQTLSEARARAVKAALTQKGYPADKISAMGFGSSRPVADNATKSGRAINRRVEIYIDDASATEAK